MKSTNPERVVQLAILLFALGVFALPNHVQSQSYFTLVADPLGSFEGPGPSAPLNWTGDGQRIGNPSFETGTVASWLQSQSNAATGSSIQLASPGQDDSWSARLSVRSGNVTTESQVSLSQDLSSEQVGFGSSIRLRASIYLEQVGGTSQFDRAEITVILSTSLGQTRTIHYYYGTAPSNGTSDAYFLISGVVAQWISIDRNIATDALARFSTDYASLNAVREVRASVLSRTVGTDPRIMYADSLTVNFAWDPGEPVMYNVCDVTLPRTYDSSCDLVISGSAPSNGAILQDDPRMKFVDANSNGRWDGGETIVYDSDNDNIYETGEPAIVGSLPNGTAFDRSSTARFDRLELYSATGNYQWVRNNGFESGLSSWGAYAVPVAFQPVTTRALSGAYSARGTITGGTVDMSQSFDASPTVESWSTFTASAYIETMTGTSSADYVDVWLGLVDNSTAGNLAFIHYFFKVGNGIIPANTTSAVHHVVPSFGTPGLWLNMTSSLPDEVSYFSTALYTLPFRVISVVVEISAQGGSATTAFFDVFSLLGPYHTSTSGPATSYRYAIDSGNSTYVYTAASVPHGAFYIVTPPGQSVLNITGPGGPLQPGDYDANALTGRVDIHDLTSFKHPPLGDWRITTTSSSAVSSVYVEDPVTKATRTSVDPGSTVNLVSRSLDPFGNPLSGASVSFTLWTSAGSPVGTPWTGTSNIQGWFNVTGVALSSAGTLKLQATTSNSYIGLRTFQVAVLYALSITMSLSTGQSEAGSPVVISGAVTPARQGVTLTIRYRIAGVSEWTDLSTVQTDANGGYSYTWRPPEGIYQVMVSATDPLTLPVDSGRAQISVSPGSPLDETILSIVIAALAAGGVTAYLFLRRRSVKRG